jgi:hypothetical protein
LLYLVLEIEKGPIHPPSWSIDPFNIHPTIESVSNSSSPSSPVTNDLLTEVEPSQPVANESDGVDLSIAGSEDDTMGTSTTPSVEQSETAEAV